ncbi:sce7726 family protein [Parapedobacter tibetensis]|uniref:sce7726 family protein n=1 Tax=Parapedobacter tibetensis TaxID=2972951 RepID=UPI00214D6657|nr:sce7726 family protein [Parapedobacter tibetensis]
MTPVATAPKVDARSLAQLMSNAGFKYLMTGSKRPGYIKRMKRYLSWEQMEVDRPETISQLLATAYQSLLREYRHEYLYKSALLNQYILRKYSLDDTILLNEFRISKSVADAVLVNGTNKVFEIKTELDTPDRLNTQLADYYKAFSQVYLFVHERLEAKYRSVVEEKVGLILFTDGGEVLESREAAVDNSLLDAGTMMRSLRKAEYLELVRSLVGFVPDVTPVHLFKTCLAILADFPVEEVQHHYHFIIKCRICGETNRVIDEYDLPHYLKFSFYTLGLNENHYLSLQKILKTNI